MAKKQQPPKLHDIVYVSRDAYGDLMIWDKASDATEGKDEKVIVGIYRLESLITVSLEVKETPLKME